MHQTFYFLDLIIRYSLLYFLVYIFRLKQNHSAITIGHQVMKYEKWELQKRTLIIYIYMSNNLLDKIMISGHKQISIKMIEIEYWSSLLQHFSKSIQMKHSLNYIYSTRTITITLFPPSLKKTLTVVLW